MQEGTNRPVPRLTTRKLRARAVNVELERPVQTSGGEVHVAPLVLIDLHTEEGITGCSYLFCYSPLALEPIRRLVADVGTLLKGDTVAPVEIGRKLQSKFLLLRPQGFMGMAMSGVDMAAWDALAKAAGMPLAELLGGEVGRVPGYGSLKTMTLDDAPEEAAELSELGFTTYKVKIGRPDPEDDLAVVHAIREAVRGEVKGEARFEARDEVEVAVDYNQLLSVPEAVARSHKLAEDGTYWIEEPTRADDFAGHARIREKSGVPLQLGENWWGTRDMTKSLEVRASDYGMADVMRIGGVTGWLKAAALAEAAGMPLSSHLFVEVSAHLLAVTPTAHFLEYLDVASPILAAPLRVEEGQALVPSRPGIGLEWDEDAVGRYLVEH